MGEFGIFVYEYRLCASISRKGQYLVKPKRS
jgi:hypothetical protein